MSRQSTWSRLLPTAALLPGVIHAHPGHDVPEQLLATGQVPSAEFTALLVLIAVLVGALLCTIALQRRE